MTRVLYDSVNVEGIPGNASFIAAYANGRFANGPAMRKRFPHAQILAIDVAGTAYAASILDYEPGDVQSVDGAVHWIQQNTNEWPTVYCDLNDMPGVITGVSKAGLILGKRWFLWIANPGGSQLAGLEKTAGVVAVQDYWGTGDDSSVVFDNAWYPAPVAHPAEQTGVVFSDTTAERANVVTHDGGRTWLYVA